MTLWRSTDPKGASLGEVDLKLKQNLEHLLEKRVCVLGDHLRFSTFPSPRVGVKSGGASVTGAM
jgi:hypothetical protein